MNESDWLKIKRPCVYFITDGEYVKIGKSINLAGRICELQPGNARKLKVLYVIYTDAPYMLESLFHAHYKDKRMCGEWFDIKEEIEKKIEEEKKAIALKEKEEKERQAAERYKNYLTTEEIAEILNVKPRTAERIINKKDFPEMKKIGGKRRVACSEFSDYLRQYSYLHKNLLDE